MSETRSSTESMKAPARLASPRCRATDPSKTSDAPARMRTPPAANHAPVTISTPVTTFNARDSRVSCHGRTPVQMRNARIPRYGHAKTRCIAPPAALSFFLGAGMSRTRGASRTGCPRSRPWTVMTGSAGDRLERDDPVAEGSSRSLVGDLVSLGRAHERRTEGRRGRDGPCSGRLLLCVFRQQVGLVVSSSRSSGFTVTSMPGPTSSAEAGASTISGSRSMAWILRMRASMSPCSFFAASYSAFSRMSPCSRAALMRSAIVSRPEIVSSSSSERSRV